MRMITPLVLSLVLLQHLEAQTIHYQLRPVPTTDRTELEVALHFSPAEGGPLTVTLPIDCYGTPNLSRFVTSFEGTSGTTVKSGRDAGERLVEPDARGEIHLKYVLSFEPMSGGTYSPNVGRDYFHVAGCQWMLRFGSPEARTHYLIEMVDAPAGWNTYSSLGAEPTRLEGRFRFRDIMIAAFGGGRGGDSRFLVRGKPVSVFVRGKFAIPQAEILAAVRTIVSLQRERFSDHSQPFYHVVILPKEDNVAGTRIENLLVGLFKTDVTREQLYVLLSHEMLHNWMTSEIVRAEKDDTGLMHQWFYEGVTDYLARSMLREAGLLSATRFAELVNRDIVNIADNPHKAATYQDVVEAARTGNFRQPLNKLSYYRGALIALNWDARIRRSTRGRASLGSLVQDVHRLARKNGGSVRDRDVFALAQGSYGVEATTDFERHIVRGEPIAVDSGALGSAFGLAEQDVPSFDAGFSLDETLRSDEVIGVVAGGPAHRAGLRDGMAVVDARNANRFSNPWDWTKPLVLVVKDNAGTREVSFLPLGVPHRLMLFRPKP